MKTRNILISLLSVAFLVACAKGTSSEKSEGSEQSSAQPSSQAQPSSSTQPSTSSVEPASSSEASSESSQSSQAPAVDKSKAVIDGFKTVRLEAEDFDLGAWAADESYDEEIVESNRASGGYYLAAAAADSGAQASFSFEITEFSRVTFYAAYAQMDSQKNTAIDMSEVYTIGVEAVQNFTTISGKETLPARNSATSWYKMQYSTQELYPGTYEMTLTLEDDVENIPSIDYVEFKAEDATIAPPVDPSTVTEDDIPDNDMRNLQQYKFLLDEDEAKYKTYATGADLSAPRGMKLKFDDVQTASKYYVQIAESEAGLDEAPVREATNKFYMFQNAKLATKYYYRAATSEAGLDTAEVKNITSTDQAPRVVSVPNVLNFRDIGGWESSLVPGAKINQGLYFRCAQLDAGRGGNTTSKLDTAGLGKAALKELGIKVDIDMRDSYNFPSGNVSAANSTEWPVAFVGAAVPSGSEPVRWEGGTYQGTNIANQYKIIFDTLANCDTDPVMLHCTYGADRTGIVTFFLESLLGMDIEDMTRDYVWTQFTQGRTVKLTESDAEFPQWISKTENCEGDTFADKMKNHLMSFGIEEETLEHIREIFVPGYEAQA